MSQNQLPTTPSTPAPVAPPATPSASLIPQTIDEALKMAKMLAQSDIVPKDFKGKEGNIFVAIQWGTEVGLPPLQALQNIAVINGRPSLWGDAVLALVKSSGLLEYIQETDDGNTATCVIKRKGEPYAHTATFSMEDAQKQGY